MQCNAWKSSPFIQWEEAAGSFIHGRAWKEQSKTKLWSDQVSHTHRITQNIFFVWLQHYDSSFSICWGLLGQTSSGQTVCLTQMQNRHYTFCWQCTNCHQLPELTVRTIFPSLKANTKGDFICSKVANSTAPGSWKAALSPGTAVMQRAISSSVSGSLETWTSSWPPWLASPSYNLRQLPACPAASSSSALNSSGHC